eukprot:c1730_g1_i1.p1 GENE.c1730_g1_i1~~c1730_g1_i1.p1  ORF type:complete len:176 (+),score=38.21 c1730_g1_i1:27-530(+)
MTERTDRLDELVVRILESRQELERLSTELSAHMKNGFIGIAEARVSHRSRVDITPSQYNLRRMHTTTRVMIQRPDEDANEGSEGSGGSEQEDEPFAPEWDDPETNPIHWFGFSPAKGLSEAQQNFIRATVVCGRLATIKMQLVAMLNEYENLKNGVGLQTNTQEVAA